jgi:hypothetical protein
MLLWPDLLFGGPIAFGSSADKRPQERGLRKGRRSVRPSRGIGLVNRVGRVAAVHSFQLSRLRDQHDAFHRRLPAAIDAPPQAFFKGLLEADLFRSVGHRFDI